MKKGGQKDPRYLTTTHLSRFAAEAGIGLRTVKVQLLDLCGKVEEAIGPLAESYREAYQRPIIIEEIVRVIHQRLLKAHSLVA